MNKILDTICGKKHSSPPVWFMRQAGRYLPEYRDIKSQQKNFLSMCYNPKIASEITLQPIKRFDFDAAIIFSDILVVPHNLGVNVAFKESVGPVVEKITNINRIKEFKDGGRLNYVYDAISEVKSKLPPQKALIGFSGSPWTVVTYLLDKKNKKDFTESRSIIYQNKNLVDSLINSITSSTIKYLKNQIKAGADIIQLFDSWSGVLSEDNFEEYVVKPNKRIISEIKTEFPHIPIIGFPKGAGHKYDKYIDNTGIDVIGVDYTVPLDIMKQFQDKAIVQGNLDPVILLGHKSEIKKAAQGLLDKLSEKPFIFNLGHGILPNTPIENVEFVINFIRKQ